MRDVKVIRILNDIPALQEAITAGYEQGYEIAGYTAYLIELGEVHSVIMVEKPQTNRDIEVMLMSDAARLLMPIDSDDR